MTTATVACALSLLPFPRAAGEEHIVGTRAARFNPMVLFVQPGDSVVWRGMEGHETQLIAEMAPAGAMPWMSELDEENFTVTFDVEGAYIYKCHTHMNAGMFGAIIVGNGVPANLSSLQAALPQIDVGLPFVRSLIGRVQREVARRTGP